MLQPTGPADVRVVDVHEPVPGPHDVLVEVHSVGHLVPRPAAEQGGVPAPARAAVHPRRRLRRHRGLARPSGDRGGSRRAPGRRRACRTAARASARWSRRRRVFPLPDRLSYDEGAALPMNYLTALFALQERGRVREGETVLVHGAAGGVGTATIQVAKGLGARTIAVVSTEEKADVRAGRRCRRDRARRRVQGRGQGADRGRGVDVVIDVVGGDVFTDSLRCLAEQGRLLVVGFAAGQGIPEVKVNRLLLGNIDVRGVGWGAYAMVRPAYMREQWRSCCR